MRLTMLAFFLCAGVTASCQPTANAPAMPVMNPSNQPAFTASNEFSLDSSLPSLTPWRSDSQLKPAKWHWEATRSDSKKISSAAFLNSRVVTVTGSGAQWPDLKREPIPTQWANFSALQIPTDWPNLKMVLIASRLNPPTIVGAPLK